MNFFCLRIRTKIQFFQPLLVQVVVIYWHCLGLKETLQDHSRWASLSFLICGLGMKMKTWIKTASISLCWFDKDKKVTWTNCFISTQASFSCHCIIFYVIYVFIFTSCSTQSCDCRRAKRYWIWSEKSQICPIWLYWMLMRNWKTSEQTNLFKVWISNV